MITSTSITSGITATSDHVTVITTPGVSMTTSVTGMNIRNIRTYMIRTPSSIIMFIIIRSYIICNRLWENPPCSHLVIYREIPFQNVQLICCL